MRDEPEAVVPYAKGGIVNGPMPLIGEHGACGYPRSMMAALPLYLSDNKPIISGFYWLKKGGELTMRQVVKRGGALMVEQQNVLCSLDVFTGSKWAGPIPEPYEEPYDERESQP